MVPDIYFGSVPPGLYALWLNNTHSKSGGGGGDPPFFHDKQGKNNPINRQQISPALILSFFVLCCYFSFSVTVANIVIIGVDQAIVKHVLKKKLKGSYGLYT